ncbi:uncharacterized protein A4U43_C05F17910 [Asparagus officinalis]|uniref:glucan endo-1,3-beta-D-glucosidase n=1 Tax=Asparagus officinalis TaxID=4686 RepID=A0A5P1ESE4_ASPOF|nr:glucan endo-1,3-beta-glucosidase 8-like [Asparagus officinalis]ONK68968.1 uncharacterized protein A4U43_C05F17910 [Asparagus officinalis]
MKFLQLLTLAFFIALCGPFVEGLGVNWGTIALRPLPPATTVKLLQDNGIKKVKLFDANDTVLNALAGSGIEVMIAVFNNDLPEVGDYDKAKEWVKNNVEKYNVKDKDGVKITCVAVGNEPFLRFYKDQFTSTTFPALKNIQKALGEAGLGDTVKVTIPLNADVYESPYDNPVPSAGYFRADVAPLMTDIVKFLNETSNPFTVNIYPFLSYYTSPNFPLDFAFFDAKANPVVDHDIKYTNVFDANFDTLVSALKKVDCGGLDIIIGEVGWPTDGNVNANVQIAQRFYDGLLAKLTKKEGTPLRPNSTFEVYMFGLYDEDQKSVLPGDFERHWGIFTVDGQPKFPMDLAGTGEPKMPVSATGVEYFPAKWCVVKPDAKDVSKIPDAMKYACDRADCTPLANGSSCGALDETGKASYVFNLYYQNQNQSDKSCDFDGLATVTTKNASQGTCNFTIMFDKVDTADLPHGGDGGSSDSSSKGGSDHKSSGSSPSAVLAFAVAALFGVFGILVLGMDV